MTVAARQQDSPERAGGAAPGTAAPVVAAPGTATPVVAAPGAAAPGSPGRPDRLGLLARWARAARATLRRHWLAAALLAVGLVLRLLALLAYRPALFYIDTPRYLYNAEGMDPVGYKGPLRAILLIANFGTVAAVQHLLALAMAVLILSLITHLTLPTKA